MEKFSNKIKEKVEKALGAGYTVILQDVKKNNDTVLKGLSILKSNTNMAPTIYLESFYDSYLNGRDMDGIVNTIIHIAQNNEQNYFDTDKLLKCYPSDKIIMQLVNMERNKEYLLDKPYVPFLDLAIIFKYPVYLSDDRLGTITITNGIAKIWGVDTERLYTDALINTPKELPYSLKNMAEVLSAMSEFIDSDIPCEELPTLPMYVLTNNYSANGAAALLYPGMLEKLEQFFDGDFIILPSSIHECIVVKAVDTPHS